MYADFVELVLKKKKAACFSFVLLQPLFLVLAHQAVHAGNQPEPLEVPESYVERYTNKIKDVKRRMFAGEWMGFFF